MMNKLEYSENIVVCITQYAMHPKSLQARLCLDVAIVEIDNFPNLEAKYDELSLVLLHCEYEICHYFLGKQALRKHFQVA